MDFSDAIARSGVFNLTIFIITGDSNALDQNFGKRVFGFDKEKIPPGKNYYKVLSTGGGPTGYMKNNMIGVYKPGLIASEISMRPKTCTLRSLRCD